MRIRPIQKIIDTFGGNENIVVLGVRNSESEERKRTLSRNSTSDPFYFRQSKRKDRTLFCPIVDFDVTDVWESLYTLISPAAIDVQELANLYRQATGECPIIRDTEGNPCSKSRFGCWTCTVIRQDRAMQGLVKEGYKQLAPLLAFRNWISLIRDDPQYRCTVRRNGNPGLGPFRIKARKIIFQHLLKAEIESGLRLITPLEVDAIKRLWKLDSRSTTYHEDAN